MRIAASQESASAVLPWRRWQQTAPQRFHRPSDTGVRERFAEAAHRLHCVVAVAVARESTHHAHHTPGRKRNTRCWSPPTQHAAHATNSVRKWVGLQNAVCLGAQVWTKLQGHARARETNIQRVIVRVKHTDPSTRAGGIFRQVNQNPTRVRLPVDTLHTLYPLYPRADAERSCRLR